MEISAPTLSQPRAALQGKTCGACGNGDDGKSDARRPGELPEDEQKRVQDLKARDREVRAHEAAHLAAAGGYAQGGANFSYSRGPDGKLYATGGEVSIDSSAVAGDPEATLRKAQVVQRAALAPAEPSGQDRQVAAEAAAMATQARQEMASAPAEETTPDDSGRDEQAGTAAGLRERIQAAGGLERQSPSTLHLIA
jgi:hypothetical protein